MTKTRDSLKNCRENYVRTILMFEACDSQLCNRDSIIYLLKIQNDGYKETQVELYQCGVSFDVETKRKKRWRKVGVIASTIVVAETYVILKQAGIFK